MFDIHIQLKDLDVFKSTDIFISIIIYFVVLKNTEKIKTINLTNYQ